MMVREVINSIWSGSGEQSASEPKPLPPQEVLTQLQGLQTKVHQETAAAIQSERVKLANMSWCAWTLTQVLPEAANLVGDGGSIVRNTRAFFNPTATGVSSLGMLGGLLGVVASMSQLIKAEKGLAEANKTDDAEGRYLSSLTAGTGISTGVVATGMLLDKLGLLLKKPAMSAAAGSALVNPGAIFLYLYFLERARQEASQSFSFSAQLNEQGVAEAVQFLKSRLSLSTEDYALINELPVEEREKAVERCLQNKCKAFERRTDQAALQATLVSIDRLNQAFETNTADESVLKEAQALIEQIAKANFTKKVQAALLFTIASAGLSVSVVALFPAYASIAPILFATVAGMWLLLDKSGVSEALATQLWWISQLAHEQLDSLLAEHRTDVNLECKV